ncbi:MAG TPA: hypothetical protein VFV81_02015, partial [Verrucomicrobiae bacterium]|nr:hypothetical protein [Verrucomicrobiae bacterium]
MLATYAPSPRFPLSRARPTPPTIRRREFVEQASPLEHRDWDESLSAHENVSFFHTAAWSRVLNDTYGHAPTWFL